MARCGIARIDQLLGPAPPAPVGAGDADALAVGAVQDLLIGQGFTGLPGPLGAQRGEFGPRTTQCVKDFQQQCGLASHGTVDAPTLRKLVDRPATAPRVSGPYVALVLDVSFEGMTRLMGLTAQFEGAGRFAAANLNTDRAGLSFGLIQWAQKPGRLSELLRAFSDQAPTEFVRILGAGDPALARALIAHTSLPRGGTDGTGASIDPRFNLVADPWVTRFRQAALDRTLQRVQLQAATDAFRQSARQIEAFAPALAASERALAFMLDLANQHGDGGARSIYNAAGAAPAAVADKLRAMADESVRRVAAQFGPGSAEAASTRSRREAFRTSPLLAD